MTTPGDNRASYRTPMSLCVSRSFHLRPDPVTGQKFQAEIMDALCNPGRPQLRIASMMGDILARMRSARRGELAEGADILPVWTQPVLWEVRWQFRKDGEYRLYHAEPGGSPDFVALRFHRKDTTSKDADVIESRQNAEMALAAARYDDGAEAR